MREAIRLNSIPNINPNLTQMINGIPGKGIDKVVKETIKLDNDIQEKRTKQILDILKADENGITYKGQKILYTDLFTKGGPNEEFFVWGLCYAITQTAYLYEIARWSPDYKENYHEMLNDLTSDEKRTHGSTFFYRILNDKYRRNISQKERTYTCKILYNGYEHTNPDYPEIEDLVKKIDTGKYSKEDHEIIDALCVLYEITPDLYLNYDYIMFDLWALYISDKKKFFTMVIELAPHVILTMYKQYEDVNNQGKLILPKRLNQKFITSRSDIEKDVTYTNFADFYFSAAIRFYTFIDEACHEINKKDNYFLEQDLFTEPVNVNEIYNFARRSYTRCLGTDEMSIAIKNNDITMIIKYIKSFYCNAQVRLNRYSISGTNNIEQEVSYPVYMYLHYYLDDEKYIIDDFKLIQNYIELKISTLFEYYYYNLLDSQRLKQKSENAELKANIAKLNEELRAMQRKNDSLTKARKNESSIDSEQLSLYKMQNENFSNIISEKNDQIDALTKEIEALKKQNELLQQDIDSLLEDDDSKTQFESEIIVLQEDKIKFINQYNVVIVGGRYDLDVKLDKLGFTNYTQVDTTSELKKNVLNPDVVIICSKFVSHSMEYTANSYYKDVPKMYFNQTNIDSFINQIYEFLNNKNEVNIA